MLNDRHEHKASPEEGCKAHSQDRSENSHLRLLACILVLRTSNGDAMIVESTAEHPAAAMGLKSATAVAWAMPRLSFALGNSASFRKNIAAVSVVVQSQSVFAVLSAKDPPMKA